jgi:hypothetical protein
MQVMKEVKEGKEAPHVLRKPEQAQVSDLVVLSEAIPSSTDWKDYTKNAAANAGL